MKKFFGKIGKAFKKFFGFIGRGLKKFFKGVKKVAKKIWKTVTNKWLLKGSTTVILVALVIAGYVGVNWAVEKAKISDWDFTTNKLYSLSDATKKRLDELEDEITIQLINMGDYTYVTEYADKYQKASDKVKVEEIDDLESRVDLQTQYNISSTGNLIVVKNGEKEKTITTSDLTTYDYSTYETIDTTEEAITNAIMEVTIEEKPHIYVLSGKTYNQPESSLGIIANELIDEANEMDLLDILTEGSVPEDCSCLIITTLKKDIEELEKDKIIEYINNGGKLLILSSQGVLEVDTPNFDQVLAQYGITLGYGAILEQDSSKMLYNTPNMIVAEASASFMDDLDMRLKLFLVNPGKIEFADSEKLEELGVTYETIASTSEESFVRTKFDINSTSRTSQDSEEGSCIVGAHVTKEISDEKTSQLIIYSDETFASTSQLYIGQRATYAVYLYNNEDVVLNSVSHLTEREDTITIRKTDETENYTVTEQEDVVIKTIIFTVPVIVIVIGIGVWIYRRRKI